MSAGKYAHYTVELSSTDSVNSVWFEHDDDDARVFKVHYKVFRVPSRKEFIVRHFHDATDNDRAHITPRRLANIPRIFEFWERRQPQNVGKQRSSRGYYFWFANAGHELDDPFMQLELEMMIDLESEVSL